MADTSSPRSDERENILATNLWWPEPSSVGRIVVPLSGLENDVAALAMAFQVARRFNSHVDAIFLDRHSGSHAHKQDVVLPSRLPADISDVVSDAQDPATLALKNFVAGCKAADAQMVTATTVRKNLSAQWSMLGEIGDFIHEARLADLVVFASPSSRDERLFNKIRDLVLFRTGRPVLLAPAPASQFVGRNVVIAWNDSREVARAMAASLPFLAAADVRVLCAMMDEYCPIECANIEDYFACHGIKAEAIVFGATRRRVGEALLQKAMELHADLLIMGCYGHSRLREAMLGGVTRKLLAHARLPILMAH